MKYYYRVIGVRTGEYEFQLKMTAVLSADINPQEHFTNLAKTFYHNRNIDVADQMIKLLSEFIDERCKKTDMAFIERIAEEKASKYPPEMRYRVERDTKVIKR